MKDLLSDIGMTHAEIDKLEAGGGLNALVAEKVMGWHKGRQYYPESTSWYGGWNSTEDGHCHYVAPIDKWSPSNSISTAWEVIEAIRRMGNRNLLVIQWSSQEWDASFCYVNGKSMGRGRAPTAPLAICRAALKAVST